MVSSGVWAEAIPLQRAHDLPEVNGIRTMKQELARIGYLGDMQASYRAMCLAVRLRSFSPGLSLPPEAEAGAFRTAHR